MSTSLPSLGLQPWSTLVDPTRPLSHVPHLVVWTSLLDPTCHEHLGTILLPPLSADLRAERPWVAAALTKRADSNAFGTMITLGRAPNNDVVLPHSAVSKFHAYIRRLGEAWLLSDARSMNGTTVNGVPLTPERAAPLTSGDRIVLGGVVVIDFLAPDELARWRSEREPGQRTRPQAS